MPTPPANGRGKEEARRKGRGREVEKKEEKCMVEEGREEVRRKRGRKEGEERGSGERERKGGVNAGMSLTYTLYLRGN